mmetsp:Transcript_38160/g.61547  ORF Transcript_38160/g.61547 Transcript_38160/m.61547 type:complete len:172 (-) Transcript_38160:48-563(-)
MGQSPGRAFCTCCVKREDEYQGLPQYGHSSAYSMATYSSSSATKTPLHSQRQLQTTPWASQAPSAPATQGLSTGPCIVCREASANTICLPCGHLLVCFSCSLRYAMSDGSGLHPDTRCPRCKQAVRSFQRVFMQSHAAARYPEVAHELPSSSRLPSALSTRPSVPANYISN